ncbi:universal stress protein PHOS34 isoform X2 [Cryptomeria japonica]|uniref:universal stress protein PHOS34 isoform X2 n=1 Tax=Cryptomeria japonica TaxID=3369 RepID=UPI0025AC48DA|nr:universal stress protein PHOS34 isoform X2 [Cryptomeria japonica]
MEEVKIGRKVMVAVDETEESMYALEWALDHLIIPGDSPASDKLILMHAQLPAGANTPLTVAFTGHVLDILERREATNSRQILTRAKGICEKRNVAVESKVVEGEAKYAICEAVNQMRVDLLVVGSRSHGAIKRAFGRSVSDYCSHNAKCPVVIVKRQDE